MMVTFPISIEPVVISSIDLTKVAPDLLQAISLTIPAIAIFIGLSARDYSRTNASESVLYLALGALFWIALAAGVNVVYLVFLQESFMIHIAAGMYLFALDLLACVMGIFFRDKAFS